MLNRGLNLMEIIGRGGQKGEEGPSAFAHLAAVQSLVQGARGKRSRVPALASASLPRKPGRPCREKGRLSWPWA